MTDEELRLVERAHLGDRAAMRALLEQLRPVMLGSAHRILCNPDDAQDVCQNALTELSLRLAEVREPEAMSGFIRKIVLHQCFDFRRRKATRRTPAYSWNVFDAQAEDADVLDRLTLWAAIESLPEPEREAVVLDFIDGWNHKDIACQASVSIATVRSRLQSAKRHLRSELRSFQEDQNMQLEPIVHQLIDSAIPGAVIDSITPEPEIWVPYSYLIVLTANGQKHRLVVRKDVDLEQVKLLPHLLEAGVKAPKLIAGPTQLMGTPWSLWLAPTGENLSRWTMNGTYHRFRTATDIVLDSLDRLQAFTPVARRLGLVEETLQDRFDVLERNTGHWSKDKMFMEAVATLRPHVQEARGSMVFTHYLHYFPNLLRVGDGSLSEIVCPFGRMEDPLLGLAMVWIYDCYPFVHTGFVEQYLVRHDVAREDFAVRLGVQALTIIAREAEENPTPDNAKYRDNLFGLVDRALGWLG